MSRRAQVDPASTTTLTTGRHRDSRTPKLVAALAYVGNVERADRDEALLHWLHVAEEVELGCGEGAARLDGTRARLVSLDRRMSRLHARITAHDGGWTLADAGSRNGTFADGERIESLDLVGGELIETGRTFWRFLRVPLPAAEQAMADREARIGPTRTICPAFVSHLAALHKVSQGTVLLLGETGTGKEILAQQIHERSRRAGGFHAINCGALPATMVESELFGHRRGAFTGATEDKVGRIEAAQGGTLLLDEVGDLPADAQVKLLRVLEEHRVTRLGETRPRSVDVRFIAATHHDLPALVEAGRYRRDLYARHDGLASNLVDALRWDGGVPARGQPLACPSGTDSAQEQRVGLGPEPRRLEHAAPQVRQFREHPHCRGMMPVARIQRGQHRARIQQDQGARVQYFAPR